MAFDPDALRIFLGRLEDAAIRYPGLAIAIAVFEPFDVDSDTAKRNIAWIQRWMGPSQPSNGRSPFSTSVNAAIEAADRVAVKCVKTVLAPARDRQCYYIVYGATAAFNAYDMAATGLGGERERLLTCSVSTDLEHPTWIQQLGDWDIHRKRTDFTLRDPIESWIDGGQGDTSASLQFIQQCANSPDLKGPVAKLAARFGDPLPCYRTIIRDAWTASIMLAKEIQERLTPPQPTVKTSENSASLTWNEERFDEDLTSFISNAIQRLEHPGSQGDREYPASLQRIASRLADGNIAMVDASIAARRSLGQIWFCVQMIDSLFSSAREALPIDVRRAELADYNLEMQRWRRHLSTPAAPAVEPAGQEKPKWDKESRTLYWQGQVAKVYKQKAEQQTTLLESFEELNWPTAIDAPVEVNEINQLIKNINKAFTAAPIEFFGNGTGKMIGWRVK